MPPQSSFRGVERTVLSLEFQSSLWLIATSSTPTFHSERGLFLNVRLNVSMLRQRASMMHEGFPDEQPANVTCTHQMQQQKTAQKNITLLTISFRVKGTWVRGGVSS